MQSVSHYFPNFANTFYIKRADKSNSNSQMKKLGLFHTLLLTVCMSAFAQEDVFESNGLHYRITSDNTADVYYMCGNDSQIIIPEKVTDNSTEKEYTVTGIYSCAFMSINITDVSIPATVKNIGEKAFYNCSDLTSLTFEGESKLEHIAEYAFARTGLITIGIPASVTSIDIFAFDSDIDLLQVYMHSKDPSGYDNDAFYECPNLTIYAPAASYEKYKNQFSHNKVEVPMDIFKPYALNTIEAGLNALNTLSDDDRKFINRYLSEITTAETFDAAYAPFTNAMPIIKDQSEMEKDLKAAIGNLGTRQNGPTIEVRAKDGTTIRLYNIEKVNFGKEGTEE